VRDGSIFLLTAVVRVLMRLVCGLSSMLIKKHGGVESQLVLATLFIRSNIRSHE
jgi:hypothetical protein